MNIWIAAGDGDLDAVKGFISQGISPNAHDDNSYTPMHAAASYGHLHILDYLIAQGGDVNVTDDDGDTPIYTVENIQTAQYLIEHGAVTDRVNNEGLSPAAHLTEDFPQVAAYLSSQPPPPEQPSEHAQHMASESLTSELIASVNDIMARAEVSGQDPEEELREAVKRAVFEGVLQGYQMTDTERRGEPDEHDDKRQKQL